MSPFEFFCTLDVNGSGRVSKIELKTGMQAIGLQISNNEFKDIWKLLKKPTKKLQNKKLTESLEFDSKKKGKGKSEDGD